MTMTPGLYGYAQGQEEGRGTKGVWGSGQTRLVTGTNVKGGTAGFEGQD